MVVPLGRIPLSRHPLGCARELGDVRSTHGFGFEEPVSPVEPIGERCPQGIQGAVDLATLGLIEPVKATNQVLSLAVPRIEFGQRLRC